ncbi:MAG: hypothetical protein GX895_02275 [Clostridiales bacterium]|uniref:DUF6465 family protein n=1 Tax=Clostridium sp. N3C TaxID=1776758 RepID=UPI00092E1442|nr:DUF6465 family protein [Clostridium sp. N3C]NLZ47610.1 hypothetical protein [Clostridiales bacterium]SCN22756.1 hypothetical protein N3C_0936 [Clostridium sp. N3C]
MGKTSKKVEEATEALKDTEVVEKKTTAKKKTAAEKKTESDKKTEKETEKKAEKKSATKKKATTKKTADKTAEDTTETTEKKTKRTTKKKLDPDFYIEYPGHQVSQKYIMEKFTEMWEKDRKLSEIKTLRVYFNVGESTAYFVVNEVENFAIYVG